MNRRQWLWNAVVAGGVSSGLAALAWIMNSRSKARPDSPIKALLFDVFGTIVEWRSSLRRQFEDSGRTRNLAVDWDKLITQWQAGYLPSLEEVRSGRRPFVDLDVLRRETLDRLLPAFGLEALTEDDRAFLVQGWSRLNVWPDTVTALTRLRARFFLTTLSNGGLKLQQRLVEHNHLPVDRVLSAEQFQHFKPDAEVYLGAARLLEREPSSLMLVAAHNIDLQAARACGLRTAYVQRPTEDAAPNNNWDLIAHDLNDLANQLEG
jgi:2-haloacid dehalogenase